MDFGILVENIMRALFYFIDVIIYKLIIHIYDIFIMLCNGRILESEVVNQLTVRIGTILGVLMMFMVVFGFIQMLLNPDTINDKEKGVGNIVKKILLVVVMLGISTYVFNLLTNVQLMVIKSNAIANLLVPNEVNTDAFGSALSGSLFSAFYTSNVDETSDYCTQQQFTEDLKANIGLNPPNFEHGKQCLYATTKVNNEEVHIREFNWLLCTVVGAVVVYFIFYYCISVGIRTVQLAALQIISPMAIISYLSPKKDNMFSKWTKLYFNTYIDVFIRIAIINFVVFLIGIILDGWNNRDTVFWESIGVDATTPWLVTTLIGVIMIIALLSFAKKAPDLIKELFPSSAGSIGFGIKSPKSLLNDTPGLARAYGAVAVGASSMGRNLRKGIGKTIDEIEKGNPGNALKEVGYTALNTFMGAGRGIVRGIGTKDAGGRRSATTAAFQAQQAHDKMSRSGYTIGKRASDMGRSFFFRDTYADEMGDAYEHSVSGINDQLIKIRQKTSYAQGYTVEKSKTHPNKYLVYDSNGNTNGIYYDSSTIDSMTVTDINGNRTNLADNRQEAELLSLQGKNRSKSSAFHNKANEQKQKNGSK